MQALRNILVSFSAEAQSAALAHMAMVNTRTVIDLLSKSDQTEELVASLAKYPGALERLAFDDLSPRWLKSLVRDVLADADSPILS